MAIDQAPAQLPIFPSSDFDRTVAFYSALEFDEVSRFGSNYLIIEHASGIELHFYGAGKVKSKSNDHAVYIRFETVEPVDELHSAWSAIAATTAFDVVAGKAGRVLPPTDTDYGLREFALLDADGNLLRIGSPTSADDE